MADRPIDQLPVKTAAQLALTDFLIGHGDGAPAAFRTELEEVIAYLGGSFFGPTAVGTRSSTLSLTHQETTPVSFTDANDPGGHINLATGEFTVPRAGFYLVSTFVRFDPGATGLRILDILGAGSRIGAATEVPPADSGGLLLSAVAMALLDVNDKIVMTAYQASGSTLNLTHARLGVAWLRPA